MTGPKPALAALLLKPGEAEAIVAKYGLKAEGELGVFTTTIAGAFDSFDPHFPIATP